MQDYPRQKMQQQWIREGITPEIVAWTQSFGRYLCAFGEINPYKKPLTTAQLRRFFGEVKRIDANVVGKKADIPMLKPLLAYAVGRDKKKDRNMVVNKTRIEEFEEEVRVAIDAIRLDNDEVLKSDYKNFVDILEAIVAYHKYYGGQENSNN